MFKTFFVLFAFFTFLIFSSTPPSRPNKASLDVHPSTKRLSDLNEIWYVGRSQCVVHDSMPYDPIQGQDCGGQKVAEFKVYLLYQYACNQNLIVNCDIPRQYQNFVQTDF